MPFVPVRHFHHRPSVQAEGESLAVGEDVDIMVDCHARPSPRMGLRFAQALEPYGLYWFEEPCWPESIDGLAEIRTPIGPTQ